MHFPMSITIQQAIQTILAAVPQGPSAETVDTVKVGDPSREITGIVVTFMATCEVIEKAIQKQANLIIAHEPTFYNHRDTTEWLYPDPVYAAKRHLIEQGGVVVWRFHDYLHRIRPDSTVLGLIQDLGWEGYASGDTPNVCRIPPTKFDQLGQQIGKRLGLKTMRVVGDPDLVCKSVCLQPGFPSVEAQVGALARPDVDVLITGEIHEWETCEYVRDAVYMGHKKGLVVIGHEESEEPGMRRNVQWLQERLPGLPIHFIAAGSPFQ
jgi:putative NIF3 family GTP cyclohydrolase 1 type 2